MVKPYHRSKVGASNLKPCVACAEPIAEEALRCRHCQADQIDGKPCRACAEPIAKDAARCRHCQADQRRWRHTANWAVPVLSLVVAVLAVLPDAVPYLVRELTGPRAMIVLRSAATTTDDRLLLVFENAGTARANIGREVACSVTHAQGGSDRWDTLPATAPVSVVFANSEDRFLEAETQTRVEMLGKTNLRMSGSDAGDFSSLSEVRDRLWRHLGNALDPDGAVRMRCRLSARMLPDLGLVVPVAEDEKPLDTRDFELEWHADGMIDRADRRVSTAGSLAPLPCPTTTPIGSCSRRASR